LTSDGFTAAALTSTSTWSVARDSASRSMLGASDAGSAALASRRRQRASTETSGLEADVIGGFSGFCGRPLERDSGSAGIVDSVAAWQHD